MLCINVSLWNMFIETQSCGWTLKLIKSGGIFAILRACLARFYFHIFKINFGVLVFITFFLRTVTESTVVTWRMNSWAFRSPLKTLDSPSSHSSPRIGAHNPAFQLSTLSISINFVKSFIESMIEEATDQGIWNWPMAGLGHPSNPTLSSHAHGWCRAATTWGGSGPIVREWKKSLNWNRSWSLELFNASR